MFQHTYFNMCAIVINYASLKIFESTGEIPWQCRLLFSVQFVHFRLLFHFKVEEIVASYTRYTVVNLFTLYYDQSSTFVKQVRKHYICGTATGHLQGT